MREWLTNRRRFSGVFGFLLLLALGFASGDGMAAGNMRCDHRVVDQGMTADEVRKLCGPPATTEDDGNTWIYDFGPGEQLKVIRFAGGKVEFMDDRARD
jgi:hypothetical protein